jgi:hypothetical protein
MDRYGVAGPLLDELRRIRGGNGDVPLYPNLVRDLCAIKAGDYDETAAHVCAVLCGWAYSDAEVVATMMVRLGLERNRCRYIGLVNGAMLVSSKAYYIQSDCGKVGLLVYQGTDPFNAVSWATDANVAPIAIPVDPQTTSGGRRAQVVAKGKELDNKPLVHGGFYINQRATWFDVQSTLLDALEGKSVLAAVPRQESANTLRTDRPPTDKLEALFVTGHSLGGAMAAIAAFRLAHDTSPTARDIVDKIRGVYTFGQPMIGNLAWAKMLMSDEKRYGLLTRGLFRHVFDCDPIPSLPPAEAGSFVHTGVELRTPVPLPDQPTWRRQAHTVKRTPMKSLELPLSFLAFVKRQLPGLTVFNGGALALPEVTIASFGTGPLLPLLKAVSPIVPKLVAPLLARLSLAIPKLNMPFSIYDHLPANYVLCSTPANKQNEFGDF